MEMCVLMQFLLTVIRSYIYTADNANCLRLFRGCRRKEMKKKKPIKSKRKTYDLSHQKTVFQNEYHAKEPCTFWQHYCLVVVRFFLFSTFPAGFFVWDFSFNNEQHCYETAPEPLRRVKYSKHVKSDLCYYITWRNRPTELAGEHHLTRWMF